LHAIVGASYGGMVALSFAARHPAQLGRIVVVSAADRPQVLSTAWRQRAATNRAPRPSRAATARQASKTRASPGHGNVPQPDGVRDALQRAAGTDAERFRFPVEGYLFARGDDYVQKYRAESFLALSESIDLHEVDAAESAHAGHAHRRTRGSTWCRSAICRRWLRDSAAPRAWSRSIRFSDMTRS